MSQAGSEILPEGNSDRQTKHPFLARPLYAFDLPNGLADSLQLRSAVDLLDHPQLLSATSNGSANHTGDTEQPSDTVGDAAQLRNGIPACTLCPDCSPFPSVTAQRIHFRSDWHRYNVQLNMRNVHLLVSQKAFEKLCEEVDSASETETDEEGNASSNLKADLVTQLLERTTIGERQKRAEGDEDAVEDEQGGIARTPLLWFVSKPDTPQDQFLHQIQLGLNRNIFPDPGSSLAPVVPPGSSVTDWYTACLKTMQTGRITRKGSKQSAWKGKRVKSKEVQDAAKAMMMTVLDGEGFIQGLKASSSLDSDADESDEYIEDSETEDAPSIAGTSSAISSNPSTDPPLRIWTVLLLGGGHFAASVIALNPHVSVFNGKRRADAGPREERSLILLAHKAFHRYTTRRKQGGGQAAQDATGRFAKSAGAQLRRYNEAALGDDIRGLLDSPGWRELIGRSEKVWIRAGARAAKGMLWSWEGAKAARGSPLDSARNDGRMNSLPFPTRRPTIGETVRCFLELARVKIEHKTDEELLAEEEKHRQSLSQKARKEADAKKREEKAREKVAEKERSKAERALAQPNLSPAEVALRSKWERLIEMVRKGRLEALITFLSKNEAEMLNGNIDAKMPDWWLQQEAQNEGASASPSKLMPINLLQIAADGGNDAMVRYLLEERRADPTVEVARLGRLRGPDEAKGEEGTQPPHRTAYDLCSTKEARNVFRRMMADHPDWYDWGGMGSGGARVPSALTEEMQESQSSKQKDRRAALREKAKERAEKAAEKGSKLEASDVTPTPIAPTPKESHHSTNRLGGAGAAPRALLQQRDEQAGLTPEMRARIEREKRARAAEERMKVLMNK